MNISSVSCAMSGLMRSGYSSISRVILLGYMSLSFEDLIIKFICWYTCWVNRRPRKVRASLPISEPLTLGHKGVCWSFKLGVDSYLEPSTRRILQCHFRATASMQWDIIGGGGKSRMVNWFSYIGSFRLPLFFSWAPLTIDSLKSVATTTGC